MTPHRHDPDAAPDFRDEFWGEQTEWTPQRRPSAERSGLGATIGRLWDGVLGGRADTSRAHGRPAVPSSPSDDSDRAVTQRPPLATTTPPEPSDVALNFDDDDTWTVEPATRESRDRGVDPLLARFGGLAVIITLAAPLVVGFTSAGADAQPGESLLTSIATASQAPIEPPVTADADVAAVVVTTEPPAAPAPPANTANTATAGSSSPSGSGDVDAESPASAAALVGATELQDMSDPEPAASTPPATTPACGYRYELAAGDYWIRIADAAEVTLADLLAVNDSSVDSVLVPGRSICLPVGAGTPSPPTVVPPAPTTTVTTAAPSRPTAATVAPTRAAAAPTTTAPARPAAVPASQAAAIIRDVWPDDLEERALEIAWRESNHRSNVSNFCCYGLFQIHWHAHKSWLGTLGVTSVSQLFDPAVNANAAYTLYQRSGGFGPWGG